MIRQRSLLTLILLSIVTCGIYGIYFWYMYVEDVNTVCAGDGDNTPNYIVVVLLSIITFGIYGVWFYYRLGNRLQNNGSRYGLAFQENGTTILLWWLVGSLLCGVGPFIAMYFLIRNMNSIADVFNRYNFPPQGQQPGNQPPPQY